MAIFPPLFSLTLSVTQVSSVLSLKDPRSLLEGAKFNPNKHTKERSQHEDACMLKAS